MFVTVYKKRIEILADIFKSSIGEQIGIANMKLQHKKKDVACSVILFQFLLQLN